ncbi:hypothetical protein SMSP2_00081 [Limihaloglobus sulfuriphilus]|uniref:DUF642 domain-containing protein n=1 Tax=Limihaloglobus sulfuriphilus TaxID=1851148 RepID=A0A1Q2MBU3_9BACT|nr:DUF642 domain-containing protein [Limihaloglobus sulfuriphilus]AQQ69747.1 hypothetical protein SMSP2_00081 [Limihaloglobus sulfuriphilus]
MCKTIITTIMVLALTVNANLIVNSGFEDPAVTATAYNLTGTDIPGWVIPDGYAVDLAHPSDKWVAASGDQSLALNALTYGKITQQIATIPQAIYELTFMYAGNPAIEGGIAKTLVTAAGSSQQYDFDTTGYTHADMGWTQQVLVFAATDNVTTVSFESLIDGINSPAIDDVSVVMTQIPEPAAIAILAIGGLFIRRKRI